MHPMLYIACGCVVADGAGRYLLVRETKAIARGRFALPAGKLEADESLVEAAVREVLEETGLEVEVTGLLDIFHCERTSEDSFGVNFVYASTAIGGSITPTEEHPEIVWKTLNEIRALSESGGVRGTHVIEAVVRLEAATTMPIDTVSQVTASS